MLALGIVAGAFDFVAIAIFPQIGERLPSGSKSVVDFGGAQPGLIPFALELGLLLFAAARVRRAVIPPADAALRSA